MTGGENVYKYITTEGKVTGKKAGKITALEYLQKSTGVKSVQADPKPGDLSMSRLKRK